MKNILFAALVMAGTLTGSEAFSQSKSKQPNIVFLLADDLGNGDLGCYGQKLIQTPNLDKLASTGLRFTQFYAGSPVCAPSRSTLMTGQHSGHTYIRGNKPVKPEGQEPFADSVLTIAEILKKAGYITGAFGKWGLGFVETPGDPIKQGFDNFFGYNCQSLAHRYYPDHLWENDTRIALEGNDFTHKAQYAPDLIQQKALAFIDQNKNKPFFLFLPYILPHSELIAPDDSLLQKYKGKFPEIPFKGNDYGPGASTTGYNSQDFPRATYAAMVSRLDLYAGQIIKKLKDLGLSDNTIVVFASDNGPAVEGGFTPDFFNSNGSLRGYKRDVYEGGIRAPLIVSWPGKIKAGTTTSQPAAMWDLFPTFIQLGGSGEKKFNDGVSIVPTLLSSGKQQQHDFFYWEFYEGGGSQAVRKGSWKAVRLNAMSNPTAALELYDISKDPAEKNNVAAANPQIIKEMEAIMLHEHIESPIFPFNGSK